MCLFSIGKDCVTRESNVVCCFVQFIITHAIHYIPIPSRLNPS